MSAYVVWSDPPATFESCTDAIEWAAAYYRLTDEIVGVEVLEEAS